MLIAIADAETSRNPWALNVDGAAVLAPDQAGAVAALLHHLPAAGNIDVGCWQISTRWHPNVHPLVALDPPAAADYAARYLRELHAETESWPAAVAAYHSRRPDRGAAYLQRVVSRLRDLLRAGTVTP